MAINAQLRSFASSWAGSVGLLRQQAHMKSIWRLHHILQHQQIQKSFCDHDCWKLLLILWRVQGSFLISMQTLDNSLWVHNMFHILLSLCDPFLLLFSPASPNPRKNSSSYRFVNLRLQDLLCSENIMEKPGFDTKLMQDRKGKCCIYHLRMCRSGDLGLGGPTVI